MDQDQFGRSLDLSHIEGRIAQAIAQAAVDRMLYARDFETLQTAHEVAEAAGVKSIYIGRVTPGGPRLVPFQLDELFVMMRDVIADETLAQVSHLN